MLRYLIGLLLVPAYLFGATASSVTQWGITWTFNADYEVGQFVTGDWWVVGDPG